MLRTKFIAISAAGMILAAPTLAFAQTRPATLVKTGYAPVNGLKLYYEIHGDGEPLILLHGGVGWSKEVAAIQAPTLLVFGDADAVRTAHAVQFFELLGGGKKDAGWDGSGMSSSRLAILPGLTHYNTFSSPALASTVTPFLDAPVTNASDAKLA